MLTSYKLIYIMKLRGSSADINKEDLESTQDYERNLFNQVTKISITRVYVYAFVFMCLCVGMGLQNIYR